MCDNSSGRVTSDGADATPEDTSVAATLIRMAQAGKFTIPLGADSNVEVGVVGTSGNKPLPGVKISKKF